jgi:DNA-binding PadR family transcriptional regulator
MFAPKLFLTVYLAKNGPATMGRIQADFVRREIIEVSERSQVVEALKSMVDQGFVSVRRIACEPDAYRLSTKGRKEAVKAESMMAAFAAVCSIE